MRIEIIADKVPAQGLWIRFHATLDMLYEILFVACLAGSAGSQPSMGDIEVAGERQSAVSFVFELAPFDFPL